MYREKYECWLQTAYTWTLALSFMNWVPVASQSIPLSLSFNTLTKIIAINLKVLVWITNVMRRTTWLACSQWAISIRVFLLSSHSVYFQLPPLQSSLSILHWELIFPIVLFITECYGPFNSICIFFHKQLETSKQTKQEPPFWFLGSVSLK